MSGWQQGGYPAQGGSYAGGYGAPPPAGGGSYYGSGYDGYDGRGAPGYGPGPGMMGAGMAGPGYRGGPRPGYPYGGGGFACVRLRGLPFGVTERDIVLFLATEPVDILPVTRGGRPTGEAYVVLHSLGDLDMALRKNRAYMGTRYIEVFEARKLEYYRAVAAAMGEDEARGRARSPGAPGAEGRERSRSRSPARFAASTSILKLRGLPFAATVDDIVAFFDDPQLGIAVPLTAEQVTICIAPDGRPTGMAFADFGDADAATAALAKDKQMMGSRYIEIFPSSTEEKARYSTAPAAA